MKKYLLLIILLASMVSAQSFTWEADRQVICETLGTEFVFYVDITNTSSDDLTLAFVKMENDLPDGWYSSFCLEVCYPDFLDSVATTDAFQSTPLLPGETREMSIHFFTGENDGTAHFKMKALSLSGDNTEYVIDLYGTTEVAQGSNAFTFTPASTTVSDIPGSELVFTFDVHNTSPVPLELKFARTLNEIPVGWSSSMCIENCYPPDLDTISMNEAFGMDALAPDETVEVSLHVFTDGNVGSGALQVKAVNPALAGDEYSVDLSASTEAANINFTLLDDGTTLADTLNSEMVFTMHLKNNSEETVTFDLVRTENDLPGDWTSSLCFDACFAPFVDSVSTTSEFASTPFAPGEEREISVHVFPMTNEGTGTVSVKVKPSNQPENYTELTFSATASLTSVKQISAQPEEYLLLQNYPNPFNPSTVIGFSIKEAGFTSVEVYNILGKKVATLVNSSLEAGNYKVDFNASAIASGVYIYRITSGSFTQTRKMILEK